MSDGMRRELVYLSSYATNRYFIPNWGNTYTNDYSLPPNKNSEFYFVAANKNNIFVDIAALQRDESKEYYKLIKRESWLRRVASKESRRLEKRLKYLYKLRKKAIKRFGKDSEQTALIERWITEVKRYMTRFTLISDSACRIYN